MPSEDAALPVGTYEKNRRAIIAGARKAKLSAQVIDRRAPCQAMLNGGFTTEQSVRDERNRVKAIFKAASEEKA